jgi:flavodoxin
MKALVIYDSLYGNTERIAKYIGNTIKGDVTICRITKADPSQLKGIDLIIIGSPTYGGRPTPAVKEFIEKITKDSIKGVNVATFDTRGYQRWLKIFGFAASKIANDLKSKGGNLVVPPAGFFVISKEGPLREGEEEHASNWAKHILQKVNI